MVKVSIPIADLKYKQTIKYKRKRKHSNVRYLRVRIDEKHKF